MSAGETDPQQPVDSIIDGDEDAEEEGVGKEDTIEYIVAQRLQKGRLMYKVHWLHSLPKEDEWFPREDLVAEFPEAVKQYEATHATGV